MSAGYRTATYLQPASLNLLHIAVGGATGRFLGQIALIEEVGEEDEITEVHDQGELDVEFRDFAFSTVGFDVVSPDVNEAADDHLSQLAAGDGNRDPPGDEKMMSSVTHAHK